MIIRWQSKSRLVGSFQQINAVVRSAASSIISNNIIGLEYSAKNSRLEYKSNNSRLEYKAN